jgi:hypothetical protein
VEDKEMVESWKGDADGMLVFVRLYTTSHNSAYKNLEIVGWSILSCGRNVACSVYPGHPAKHARHLSFLSRKSLPIFHPVEFVQVQPHRTIHSAYIEYLGQRALVLESGHQSDLRSIGDIDTTMGAALS